MEDSELLLKPINWNYSTLVLSGGGVRGLSLVGALHVLEEHSCLNNLKTYIGTSIGALICSLLAIGYTTSELNDEVWKLNMPSLRDINVWNVTKHYGLDSGKEIEKWMCSLFKAKSVSKHITFKQLFDKNNITLVLTGTCINTHSLVKFNYLETPDLEIVKAIRMSISLPLIFTAPRFHQKIIIDGGLLDNFPLSCLKDHPPPLGTSVLALKLTHSYSLHKGSSIAIHSFQDYCRHLFYTFMDEISTLKMNNLQDISCEIDIIEIDTQDFSSLPTVDLKKDDKMKLFNFGRYFAANWLEERISKHRWDEDPCV